MRVTELDARIFAVLSESLGGVLPLMAVLTVVGGGYGAIALVPLIAARRTRAFATALAVTLAVNAVVVFVLKRAVARPRPCACLEGVTARVFAAPTDFSFPSGHAAGSFAFAVFVALVLHREGGRVRQFVAALLLLLAAGVALSRVALGVHFPGDVAAGAAIGALMGAAGASRYLARRERVGAIPLRG